MENLNINNYDNFCDYIKKEPFSVYLEWREIKEIMINKYDFGYFSFLTDDNMVYFYSPIGCNFSWSFFCFFESYKRVFVHFSANKDLKISVVKEKSPFFLDEMPVSKDYFQKKRREQNEEQ